MRKGGEKFINGTKNLIKSVPSLLVFPFKVCDVAVCKGGSGRPLAVAPHHTNASTNNTWRSYESGRKANFS